MMVSCNNQAFSVLVPVPSLLLLPQNFFQNLLWQKPPAAKCNSRSLAKLKTSVKLYRASGPAVPQYTCHKLHPLPVVLKMLCFRCHYYLSQQKEIINLFIDATEWCIFGNCLDQCRKYPDLILGVKINIRATFRSQSLAQTHYIDLQNMFSITLKALKILKKNFLKTEIFFWYEASQLLPQVKNSRLL